MSEPVLTALIIAIVALAGVWRGRSMERDNEMMKWRRERCLESYADLFATCEALLVEASRAVQFTDPRDKAVITQNDEVLKKLMEMFRLSNKATLVGSAEVNEALNAMTTHYQMTVVNRAVHWPKPSTEEWHQFTRQAGDLSRRAHDLARRDLRRELASDRSWAVPLKASH